MSAPESAAVAVPKRVEEALFFRLKQKAFDKCHDSAKAYADCCRGRLVSLAWSCRQEAKVLSACMTHTTGRLDALKARWLAAGGKHPMTEGEWDTLLDSLLDD